ncbi:MAG: ABC transporter ATP-binding protein [bacterium]
MTILEACEVSKTYRKGKVEVPALRDVSFRMDEGDFVSIVGRSGSGKSTLLNLVAGLDRATSGRILFRGKDLTQMSRAELAYHRRFSVGMVFQAFNLIPHRTALENVALALTFGRVPRSARRDRAADLLGTVGLKHRMDHRPGELSGGETQRVAIARALANSPEALILDEPTGNLDTSTSQEIIGLLQGLNGDGGITVLMVTHEQDLADTVSTRVIRLKDGSVQ